MPEMWAGGIAYFRIEFSMTPPGRELDVRVAKALGWTQITNLWGGVPPFGKDKFEPVPSFSTFDPVALELFKETIGLGGIFKAEFYGYGCGFSDPKRVGEYASGDTIAHAVCLAFLEVREGRDAR